MKEVEINATSAVMEIIILPIMIGMMKEREIKLYRLLFRDPLIKID